MTNIITDSEDLRSLFAAGEFLYHYAQKFPRDNSSGFVRFGNDILDVLVEQRGLFEGKTYYIESFDQSGFYFRLIYGPNDKFARAEFKRGSIQDVEEFIAYLKLIG